MKASRMNLPSQRKQLLMPDEKTLKFASSQLMAGELASILSAERFLYSMLLMWTNDLCDRE